MLCIFPIVALCLGRIVMDRLLISLGEEIVEPEEEWFFLFAQVIPSRSLGFYNGSERDLDITVSGRDFSIHQSPSLLTSDRKEGTTGAVLWQVTPRLADWIASPTNIFFTSGLLSKRAHVLELGCGVCGLVALTLAPMVKTYIATDQDYVLKLLRQNIAENSRQLSAAMAKPKKGRSSSSRLPREDGEVSIVTRALDWETDSPASLYRDLGLVKGEDRIDLIISCDCIYNEALIQPFVDTCVDICRLAPASNPTLCVIAQQLRSPDIFESWLKTYHSKFRVWRMPKNLLSPDLGEGSGFVVHVGQLRESEIRTNAS